MPKTPKGYPYPTGSDTPDVPRDVAALATEIDDRLPGLIQAGMRGFGTLAAASATSLAVTFPIQYDEPPVVVVSCDAAPKVNGGAVNITALGFDFHVANTDTVARGAVGHWAAFGGRVTMP